MITHSCYERDKVDHDRNDAKTNEPNCYTPFIRITYHTKAYRHDGSEKDDSQEMRDDNAECAIAMSPGTTVMWDGEIGKVMGNGHEFQ